MSSAALLQLKMNQLDLIIRNGRLTKGKTKAFAFSPVKTPQAEKERSQDIGIRDGRIVYVGRNLNMQATNEIDANGEVVIPFFQKVDRMVKSNQSSRSNSRSLPSLTPSLNQRPSVKSNTLLGPPVEDYPPTLSSRTSSGNEPWLKNKEFGIMLAKTVQQLQRKNTLRGKSKGHIAHLFKESLDKAATPNTFFALLRNLGVQTAKWRVGAFFEIVFGRNRNVPTEELIWFFESLSKFQSQSKREVWRCPEHHTAKLTTFVDPNKEATCMKKRRPSAIDGTSMNLLGARRISSEAEKAALSEEFSARKRERALHSVHASIIRKLDGKDIEKVFNTIDTDGNRTLSRFEVKTALRKIGVFHLMSPQICKAMFDEMDLNNDGEVDMIEWKKYMDVGRQRESFKKNNKLKHLASDHMYNRRSFA
jgi:Ca2+-binding EF-hand superfamily protein